MKNHGFSLLELLVVLSILGILLAVALPNYTQHVLHARRLAAASELLRLAGQMEAFYAEHNTYEGAHFTALTHHHYRFIIQQQSAMRFILAAIPEHQDPRCGSLTLNSQGIRGSSGSGTLSNCW